MSVVAPEADTLPEGSRGQHTTFKFLFIRGFLGFGKKTLGRWEEVVGDRTKAAYFSDDDLEKQEKNVRVKHAPFTQLKRKNDQPRERTSVLL